VDSVAELAGGADPNQRGSFGGPSHREGVTAIHLAAQGGHGEAVIALLADAARARTTDRR
jgi:hypothetical protein